VTNDPLAELLGIPGVQERTTNLSPNNGLGKSDGWRGNRDACTRVVIVGGEEVIAIVFDDEEQYRS